VDGRRFWVGVVMFLHLQDWVRARCWSGFIAYAVAVFAVGTLTVSALDQMARETAVLLPTVAAHTGGASATTAPLAVSAPKSEVLADSRTAPYQVAQFWSNRPSQFPSQPRSLGVFGGIFNIEPTPPPETYATVCVRLCDGFYWPVSFSTSPANFGADEQACRSSCTAPTRLFVHRNPGGSTDDMQDTHGRPYSRLPNAFLYRTSYDQSCKCKPHPWEQQALDRHRVYALQQTVAKGDRTAAAELRELRSRLADANPPIMTASSPESRVRPEPPPGLMALGAGKGAKAPDKARVWRDSVFNR